MDLTGSEIEAMKRRLYEAFSRAASRCEEGGASAAHEAQAMGQLAAGYAALVHAEPINSAKYNAERQAAAFREQCSEELKQLEKTLGESYARQIDDLRQTHTTELGWLNADADREKVLERQQGELDRMKGDQAADLERRMAELRQAHLLQEECRQRQAGPRELSRSR